MPLPRGDIRRNGLKDPYKFSIPKNLRALVVLGDCSACPSVTAQGPCALGFQLHPLTQCVQTPDLGSAQDGGMTSGPWQALHAVCPPWITPIPWWGLQQSADRAEGQQAVRKLCKAPWRQETLASCEGRWCHWTLYTEKQTFF